MDHMKKRNFQKPDFDVTELSEISYLIQEDFEQLNPPGENTEWTLHGCARTEKFPIINGAGLRLYGEDTILYRSFRPVRDKLVVSLWVKMDNPTTGVNVVSLYGSSVPSAENKILCLDTEGAYFYAYDGNSKKKLCRYQSDDWYSIYITVNIRTASYTLYVDGEKLLSQAELIRKPDSVQSISMGSYGGALILHRLHLYENPVPSVELAAHGKVRMDAAELGVEADGKTVVTEKLQQLIDACSIHGGVVYLREGTYLTGCLKLKENVTLYIDERAVLKGVLDLDAYPVCLSETHPNWNTLVQGPQKALIYADSQDNICIMGGGTIDGSGDFPGAYGSESLRVSAILLVGCRNARICDVHIRDAGMWTVPVVECDNLYIRDVNIDSTWYPNRDGIDICDCCQVLIENCNIKSDDDAVCFKSGNESGCDNVLVRHTCIISTMANGIKFGTYSYGGFTNCICEDCIVKDTRTCAIAVQCVDGGQIKNLHFRRILIQNVESVFFILIGDKGRFPDWGEHRIGSIEELYFEDIYAERVRRSYGNYLGGYETDGIVYRIRDIFFSRVRMICQGGICEIPPVPPEFGSQYPESNCFGVLPAAGYFIRHAEHITFTDCETLVALPDARPSFALADASEVSCDTEYKGE